MSDTSGTSTPESVPAIKKAPSPVRRHRMIMLVLWFLLLGGLGAGFASIHRDSLRRERQVVELALSHPQGVPLPDPATLSDILKQCEQAARNNPSSPKAWSIWALTHAQAVLFLGEDPAEYNRIQSVATGLFNRLGWPNVDSESRMRLLAARSFARTAQASTRPELQENFYESLRAWDMWPDSPLLHHAVLWAAANAGHDAYVEKHPPPPEDPLFFPFTLDRALAREDKDTATRILEQWKRQAPHHPMVRLANAWMNCESGEGFDTPYSFPVLESWRNLVRACSLRSTPEKALEHLERVQLVEHEAVVLGVMQLALELHATHLYSHVKNEVTKARTIPESRARAMDALEKMLLLEPRAAFSLYADMPVRTDPHAVWAALLAGDPHTARKWSTEMAGADKLPDLFFQESFTNADLAQIDAFVQQTDDTRRPLYKLFHAIASLQVAATHEPGTEEHERRHQAVLASLDGLEQSSFTATLRAQSAFALRRMAETETAFSRICGTTAFSSPSLGDCHIDQVPMQTLDLFLRVLTAEEGLPSVDYPLGRDRLEHYLPLFTGPQRLSEATALFWKLRFFRFTLRAFPGQSKAIEEKIQTLDLAPAQDNPETLTEAALLFLTLGQFPRAASFISRIPADNIEAARRLSWHYLVIVSPKDALRLLDPVLRRTDLSASTRLVLRTKVAEARMQLKEDVRELYEELYRLDPCPEMAVATLRAYLVVGRREDCPRMQALTQSFREPPPDLVQASADVKKFCGE